MDAPQEKSEPAMPLDGASAPLAISGEGSIWRRIYYSLHPFVAPHAVVAVYGVMLRKKMYLRYLMSVLFLLIFYVLLFRHLFSLQIINSEDFDENAAEIVGASGTQSAPRGRIWDNRGMTMFACDLATRDIFVEPRHFAKNRQNEILKLVCNSLKLDVNETRRKWLEALSYEKSVEVISGIAADDLRVIEAKKLPGVLVSDDLEMKGTVVISYYPLRAERNGADPRKIASQLGRIFGISTGKMRAGSERAYNRVRQVVVKRDVPRDTADLLERQLREKKLHRGFVFRDSWVRNYPQKYQCANLLGYLNDQYKGVSGIEMLMDRVLQPTVGKFVYKHDKYGRPVEEGVVWKQQPQAGADVYLTINSRLQQIAEEELTVLWEKFKPERAYAIMADPSTGAILALAQFPQFDPNDKNTMKNAAVTTNHCMVQAYEPGSIMKGISLTGVLEHRIAGLDTKIDCEGGRWYYNRSLLKDSHKTEILTLAEVVEQSSNIGTAKFSLMLGDERVYQNLALYGFGKPTGLGFYPDIGTPVVFKNEAKGRFKPFHAWDTLTVTRMPMGQGLSLTPLQIVQAWSALANHGVMMQPYIIDKVKFPNGVMRVSVPRIKGVTASASAVDKIVKALVLVTEGPHATGKRAAIPGYHVAGKTGTAQFWVPADKEKAIKGHYSTTEYQASFVGFVPAEKPAFLLLVTAERPSLISHTGSGVAAPVFKRIAERALDYLQVPKEYEPVKK